MNKKKTDKMKILLKYKDIEISSNTNLLVVRNKNSDGNLTCHWAHRKQFL
jgi:hypothetical protein